ncbi:MAG: hypothetical protein AAF639_05975 [Chloroflexota bacterium]
MDGTLVSRAIHPDTREQRTIHGAIAGVSPATSSWGRSKAVGLNFARMAACRPVVGYANELYLPKVLPHMWGTDTNF